MTPVPQPGTRPPVKYAAAVLLRLVDLVARAFEGAGPTAVTLVACWFVPRSASFFYRARHVMSYGWPPGSGDAVFAGVRERSSGPPWRTASSRQTVRYPAGVPGQWLRARSALVRLMA
jgi:hypothetical protein